MVVACCSADREEHGYATASAIAVTLALSVTASAVMGVATAELRNARRQLERTQREYALNSGQTLALLGLMRTAEVARFHWTIQVGDAAVDAVAEPEAAKLSYDTAAALPDVQLQALGAAEPPEVRARLRAAARMALPSRPSVASLDRGARWRACGASYISPYGQGAPPLPAVTGAPSATAFSWREGELWRVSVRDAGGWREERLVRFTGNADAPAAVLERNITMSQEEMPVCEIALQN